MLLGCHVAANGELLLPLSGDGDDAGAERDQQPLLKIIHGNVLGGEQGYTVDITRHNPYHQVLLLCCCTTCCGQVLSWVTCNVHHSAGLCVVCVMCCVGSPVGTPIGSTTHQCSALLCCASQLSVCHPQQQLNRFLNISSHSVNIFPNLFDHAVCPAVLCNDLSPIAQRCLLTRHLSMPSMLALLPTSCTSCCWTSWHLAAAWSYQSGLAMPTRYGDVATVHPFRRTCHLCHFEALAT